MGYVLGLIFMLWLFGTPQGCTRCDYDHTVAAASERCETLRQDDICDAQCHAAVDYDSCYDSCMS
jgi:hypothetical protein